MSEERPVGCPIEFAEIFDWDEETAEQAGLRRYFDDELCCRALYLFPNTWLEFMPEGLPVIDMLGGPTTFFIADYADTMYNIRGCLACGVWIEYSARYAAKGMVNSDTD